MEVGRIVFVPTVLGLISCTSPSDSEDSAANSLGGTPTSSGSLESGNSANEEGQEQDTASNNENSSPSSGDAESNDRDSSGQSGEDDSGGAPDMGSDNQEDTGIRFDVPEETPGNKECEELGEGIHCRDTRIVVECNEKGERSRVESCLPNLCAEGIGCVICRADQNGCFGDRVMECDTTVKGHQWKEVAVCDASRNEVCDHKTGTCIPVAVTGDATPTGQYFQFSSFTAQEVPEIGTDGSARNVTNVDSYENKIYASGVGKGGTASIKVFEVELLDSDGDGQLEPNQHPENPDATGPIEERLLHYVETIVFDTSNIFGDAFTLTGHESELYVTDERLYFAGIGSDGMQIIEYNFATGSAKPVTAPNSWSGDALQASVLGYDEIHDIWYAGYRQPRGVKQYDAVTETWGWAFQYPNLSGDHMDGMEVVAAREVDSEGRIQFGEPYVYVSDMTSDFIGQYRLDIKEGWVQENLFEYNEPGGKPVEGFGFGALNHFWASSHDSLYELGGGDLAKYTEPVG